MPRTRATPDAVIATALARFLRHRRPARVYFAEDGAIPPPPLAYFVHFPRLYVALSGHDAMWLEQGGSAHRLRLAAGDAVVVPANCWNRPAPNPRCVALHVLFGRRQIGLSLVAHDANGTHPAAKTTFPAALEEAPRSIMHALLAVRTGAPEAALPLVDALLRSTRQALTTAAPTPRRRAANLYESVCMYVQEHFQTPLSREAVAAHFKVSPNHISRLFKREGMVSFNRYVTYVRMNWAKHLLQHHHQTIDEVASMCGFSETGYFCRIFKARTKLTPSQYRQSARPPPPAPAA